MDLLYVRCTLEHYDTTYVKHFSGALHVDCSENSFKVVGSSDEHKFYAREFTPLGGPPTKSTAKQIWLDFDLSKQHSGRHQIRKRKIIFRTTEESRNIKEVYDRLRKIFSKQSSPARTVNGMTSPPVGVLRSRPDGRKHNVFSPNGRQNPSIAVTVPSSSSEFRNGTNQSNRKSNTLGGNLNNGQADTRNQDLGKLSRMDFSKNDLKKPGTSANPANTRLCSSESYSKSGVEDVKLTANKTIAVSTGSVASCGSPVEKQGTAKEQRDDKTKANNNNDSKNDSQGSIGALLEMKAAESSSIKVSASFKVHPHTATFRSKRNGPSPTSSTLAKKPALDLNHGQVSSPRCLVSSPFGPQGARESPLSASRYDNYRPYTFRERAPARTTDAAECSMQDSADMTSLRIHSATEQSSTYSYRGLENLTNSCYMNATLQALASVFPFYYRMQMIHHRREQQGQNCSEFVKRFSDVLKNLVSPDRPVESMYGSATKVSVLEALRTAAGKELGSDPDFGSNMQQDAHEFLAKTLDILEKESTKTKLGCAVHDTAAVRTKSPSDKGFNFIRYGCERCARANEMTNDAIDLTVTVSAGESIQKMIENALAREEIEYKCEHCGSGPGFICRAFAALPLSLIVVVKRYRFGEAGGSKVEEKINVSRELFLKDLYVDSEVKKQEGVARRSLSQSTESFNGDRRQNGHVDDGDGVAACSSTKCHIDVGSESSFDVFESDQAVHEVSIVDSHMCSTCFCDAPTSFAEAANMPSSSAMGFSNPAPRVALSPLKMNKMGFAGEKRKVIIGTGKREEWEAQCTQGNSQFCISYNKVFPRGTFLVGNTGYYGHCETSLTLNVLKFQELFESHSKANIIEDFVLGSPSRLCGKMACEPAHPEKENVEFPFSNVYSAVDNGVVKQTGGYLKENLCEEKSGIVDESYECAEHEDANANSSAENGAYCAPDDNAPGNTRTGDRERICLENNGDDAKGVINLEDLFSSPSRGDMHPDHVTKPLKPSLRTSVVDSTHSLPAANQDNVAVISKNEEQITLIFRPVQEECQKKWCSLFGLRYVGSPERMSEDGEWGTQVELVAAACFLGVNIYTFLEGRWLRYRPLFRWSMDGSAPIMLKLDECNEDKGAIFISNASGCHFQPAISIDHVIRRNLRSRKERDFTKEASPCRASEPPYVFKSSDGPVYSLSAVICHHGDSLLSGHYSTFALDATRQEWLDCNDNVITKLLELQLKVRFGEYDDAIACLHEVIRDNRDFIYKVIDMVADDYIQRGMENMEGLLQHYELDQGVAIFRKAADGNPQKACAIMLAFLAIRPQAFNAVSSFLMDILRKSADPPHGLYAFGNSLLTMNFGNLMPDDILFVKDVRKKCDRNANKFIGLTYPFFVAVTSKLGLPVFGSKVERSGVLLDKLVTSLPDKWSPPATRVVVYALCIARLKMPSFIENSFLLLWLPSFKATRQKEIRLDFDSSKNVGIIPILYDHREARKY
uniref:USP domain-containing protein n=1 Tax=Angiostrongylus cantonensis TaxID=6313 RepID=A0A158PBU2_ANGCA